MLDSFRSPYRLLVVADEGLAADAAPVRGVVDRHRRTGLEVLVVAPASAGRRERATPGGLPRPAAEARLLRCLDALRAEGVRAEGLVGDVDPLRAIAEALRLFDADAVVVAAGHGQRPPVARREAAAA
jgi:GABA permease